MVDDPDEEARALTKARLRAELAARKATKARLKAEHAEHKEELRRERAIALELREAIKKETANIRGTSRLAMAKRAAIRDRLWAEAQRKLSNQSGD